MDTVAQVVNPVRVFHVRDAGKDPNRKKVMTIATEVLPDNSLMVGFAFCSKRDMFNKKIGAIKAIGRMRSANLGYITRFSGHSADDVTTLWNDLGDREKPSLLRNKTLVNIPQTGLTLVKYVGGKKYEKDDV